jgi:hypothetical protein
VTCECCGNLPSTKKGMCLDHDHSTGAFRGWLCNRCNLGIGLLGDTQQGLKNAIMYLHRHYGKQKLLVDNSVDNSLWAEISRGPLPWYRSRSKPPTEALRSS